jgi:hypothetical protein
MKFQLSTLELSEAAIKDAKNFGLSAKLTNEDGQNFVEYESKAYCDTPTPPANPTWDDYYALSKSVYSEMQYQLKWIREDYKYLSEAFREHQRGHIPAVQDVGKMKQIIETLGLSESYDVAKKTIYVEW